MSMLQTFSEAEKKILIQSNKFTVERLEASLETSMSAEKNVNHEAKPTVDSNIFAAAASIVQPAHVHTKDEETENVKTDPNILPTSVKQLAATIQAKVDTEADKQAKPLFKLNQKPILHSKLAPP